MHAPTAYRLPPPPPALARVSPASGGANRAAAQRQRAAADRKIAVFRALYLGDLLLAVPALRALRAGFPEAEITLIGLPWAASFARRFRRYVDRFVEFGGYPGIDEVAVDPGRSAHFVEEQRAYGYDLVVQMQGSGRTSNPCALALGGRMTAGYYDGESPPGLTFGAPYPDDQPEVLRNVGLARLLGCPIRGLELEFPLFARDRAEAAALLTSHSPAPSPSRSEGERAASPLPRTGRGAGGEGSFSPLPRQGEGPGAARWPTAPPRGLRPRVRAAHGAGRARRARGGRARRPLIGIHAGAHVPARRWPAEHFAVVADQLAQRFGAQIVLTGGPGEEEIAQAVAERMAAPALCVAGQTSLGGLAALIDRLDLFIANDTGPAHLADALGTPSVTIFGPADHRRWAPLDQRRHPIVRRPVSCSPCRYVVCPIDHRCLLLLEPDAVIEAAESLLVQGVQATVARSLCRLHHRPWRAGLPRSGSERPPIACRLI